MSDDIRARADQLAELIDEFRLDSAKLEGDDWKIAFRKTRRAAAVGVAPPAESIAEELIDDRPETTLQTPAAPSGTPVTSPMTGIYYSAPSPSSPPFVREGDPVNAGQVVGLIEAMKVFNEIVAPMSGTVARIVAKSGDVVNPGEPLLYIS